MEDFKNRGKTVTESSVIKTTANKFIGTEAKTVIGTATTSITNATITRTSKKND